MENLVTSLITYQLLTKCNSPYSQITVSRSWIQVTRYTKFCCWFVKLCSRGPQASCFLYRTLNTLRRRYAVRMYNLK